MAHWTKTRESSGGLWQMRFLFWLYRRLGPKGIQPLLSLVVFFYWLVSAKARRLSRVYLSAVFAQSGKAAPRSRDVYQHFRAFSFSLLEKISAWAGDIRVENLVPKTPDLQPLVEQLQRGQGAVVLCSHLGNVEVLRALGSLEAGKSLPKFGLYSIVDFSGTSRFNQFLREINPESMVHLISTKDLGADTIIWLKDRLASGDLVVIAADRTPPGQTGRVGQVDFLGRPAWFPQGGLILASLMDAPVYHMFAVRERDLDFSSPYEFHVFRSRWDLAGSRKERMAKIQGLMQEFVGHLETLCMQHAYQWYNFFDFWHNPEPEKGQTQA